MGSRFEELAAMRAGVERKNRIGFCLDTAHTIGAGYGFSTAHEVLDTLQEFDSIADFPTSKPSTRTIRERFQSAAGFPP
jgi:deoxyribonuclease IV